MSAKAVLSTQSFLNPRASHLCNRRHHHNAFISPVLDKFQIISRQTSRSFEFWRRVLHIWASFKMTQVIVHMRRGRRDPTWEGDIWKAQHEKAGSVSWFACDPWQIKYSTHLSTFVLTKKRNSDLLLAFYLLRWCWIFVHQWKYVQSNQIHKSTSISNRLCIHLLTIMIYMKVNSSICKGILR